MLFDPLPLDTAALNENANVAPKSAEVLPPNFSVCLALVSVRYYFSVIFEIFPTGNAAKVRRPLYFVPSLLVEPVFPTLRLSVLLNEEEPHTQSVV